MMKKYQGLVIARIKETKNIPTLKSDINAAHIDIPMLSQVCVVI